MAPPGPQLVHKQFNSPMGLYSQQNIQETLGRHIKNLDNGAVGIDWNSPGAEQPASLANSAVLKLLQEEEREKYQTGPGKKKVVWPPSPETNGYHSSAPEQQQHQQQQPPQQRYPAAPPSHASPRSPAAPYGNSANTNSNSAVSEGRRQEQCGLSKLIPCGPGGSARPAPGPRSPAGPRSQAAPRSPAGPRWAPVPAPAHTQVQVETTYGTPSGVQQQSYSYSSPQPQPQPQGQTQAQGYSEQSFESYRQSYSSGGATADRRPQWARSPPPSTITLRPSLALHQPPPPVYTSQPAAHNFQGGVHGRGDSKWPPQSVREAVAAENEARRSLAKGPACRPRKVSKDYSSFFAEHALSGNYVSYRAPPGTQHYDDLSGRSSY